MNSLRKGFGSGLLLESAIGVSLCPKWGGGGGTDDMGCHLAPDLTSLGEEKRDGIWSGLV